MKLDAEQWTVLRAAASAGRHPSMRRIAAAAGLERWTDARDILAPLEKRGLIRRTSICPHSYVVTLEGLEAIKEGLSHEDCDQATAETTARDR